MIFDVLKCRINCTRIVRGYFRILRCFRGVSIHSHWLSRRPAGPAALLSMPRPDCQQPPRLVISVLPGDIRELTRFQHHAAECAKHPGSEERKASHSDHVVLPVADIEAMGVVRVKDFFLSSIKAIIVEPVSKLVSPLSASFVLFEVTQADCTASEKPVVAKP